MALQHSITLPNGVTCSAAYTRISSASYSKDKLLVGTITHVNEAARIAGKDPIRTKTFTVPWAEPITLEYCYDELKEFAEFSDATDV